MSGIAKPKEAGLEMFIAVENLPESPVIVKVKLLTSWRKIFTLIDTVITYILYLQAEIRYPIHCISGLRKFFSHIIGIQRQHTFNFSKIETS